jgi:hypothetical protein
LPRERINQCELRPVQLEGADCLYIASNPWLEQLLFNRSLVGTPFSRLCLQSVQAMVAHFTSELKDSSEVAELILLSKGSQYRLGEAMENALGYRPQTNFLAASRKQVAGTEVKVGIDYGSLDAPTKTIVIGDTVASGETICTALEYYLRHHDLERVLLLSLAGSTVGAARIGRFCTERAIELTMVYGLAAFGLSANGFDLSFLHPDTICEDRHEKRAAEVFEGLPISAVGWDFGSQVQAIEKYRALCWVEAKYWGLEGSDLFAAAKRPTRKHQIEHEYAAYRDRLPDVSALLVDGA